MFTRGDSGYVYLHDQLGRIVEAVGDGVRQR